MADDEFIPPLAAAQPISSVRWVETHRLHANAWNPNHVAPTELQLLKLSILEDGWTTAIVVRPHDAIEGDFEVVDGFHRWTLASKDPAVAAVADGLVPVVQLTHDDPAQLRMATVRHNRARGTHLVLRMADLVDELARELGVDETEIERRLGMDDEEVRRLLQRGKMTERGANTDGLGEAWRPAPVDRSAAPS